LDFVAGSISADTSYPMAKIRSIRSAVPAKMAELKVLEKIIERW